MYVNTGGFSLLPSFLSGERFGPSARGSDTVGRTLMDPRRKLKGLLARIFSDAVAEESERAELRAYLASGVLTEAEIKEVFEDFVQTTWKITIADGVVSDREKQRLREIVDVLKLDASTLPKEWAAVLEPGA
jgi:uncharacterized tellurite resistance protein B-like protein